MCKRDNEYQKCSLCYKIRITGNKQSTQVKLSNAKAVRICSNKKHPQQSPQNLDPGAAGGIKSHENVLTWSEIQV